MAASNASLADTFSDKVSRFFGGGPLDEAQKAVRGMKRQDFERIAAAAFRAEGYAVQELGETEEVADLVVSKGGRSLAVLCREFRASEVGMDTIKAFHNAIAARHAAGGFLLASGKLEEDVREVAPHFKIQIVGGAKLVELIQKGRRAA